MATRRIKEITNTATTFASDDFIALDGTTQGTRKMDKDDLIAEVSAGVSGDYLEEANNLSDVASLDTSKLNMEIPDVGTAPNEVSLNGQLGSMAFQSAEAVSIDKLEVTDKIDLSGAPTQQLEISGDAPTVRVTDTSVSVADGESIGKLEFYGNDGSSGGPNVRARIDTVAEAAAGNYYGLAISTSSSNASPVEHIRIASNGNTGIGTAEPNALLECYDTVKPVIRLSGSGNNAGSTNYGSIEFYNRDNSGDGPNVGAQIHVQSASSSGSGGDLVFSTETVSPEGEGNAPVPRMTIDHNGLVGIGTSSPSGGAVGGKVLHVQTSGETASVRVDRTDAAVSGTLSITCGSSTNGLYSTGTKALGLSTNGTQRWLIDGSNGNLISQGGSAIDFGSGSTGSGTVSGGLLDDYEVGTFTPTLTPTTSGSITLDSGFDTLSYTKVGRMVTIMGLIKISSVSSPVGQTTMSMPFTIRSIDNVEYSNRVGGAVSFLDATTSVFSTTVYNGNQGDAFIYIPLPTFSAHDQLRFSFSFLAA